MAGQATKNRQNDSDSSWAVPDTDVHQPPPPIAGISDDSWLSTPSKATVASNPFPGSDGGVQLVQHTEPATENSPASLDVGLPTLQIPDGELPTFREPAAEISVAEVTSQDSLELPNPTKTQPEETGPAVSMSLPSDETAPLPTAPAITIGLPSVVATEAGPTDAAMNQVPNDEQPGNILRGGAGNGLRGGYEDAAEMVAAHDGGAGQHAQPITSEAAPMLRAISLPGQPAELQANDAATQGLDVTSGQLPHAQLPSGNAMVVPESSPNSNPPGIRIVNPDDPMTGGGAELQIGNQGFAPQGFAAPGFAPQGSAPQGLVAEAGTGQLNSQGRGELRTGNSFPDSSFNQPAANYGPPTASPSSAQPVAPPLPGGSYARIASLPDGNMIRSPGYQPNTFQQPSSAAELNVDPSATMASPGDRRFEGVQSPSIVIHKRAPAEVKVGKPAQFIIHVQNVGPVEALDVRVTDRVPAGMQLVDASPSPVQQGDVLVWQLGSMKAGDERTVTLRLVPMEEGELGSVARVTFEAAASVRTMSTRPELKIVQRANEKVLIGQQLEIDLEFSNPGTGAATGVIIQEDVPEGLEHPKGRQLDNAIGSLKPGETRRQVLRLRAVAPGIVQNTIRLTGDDGLEATHTVAIEVVAPQLQVALQGPSRGFLERQVTYQLDIANSGTADATNVEIAAYLDRGFTFVSTDFEGQYDPSRHAVFWSLANLPPTEQGKVPLTILPVSDGERAIRLEARADLGVVAKNERTVNIDSRAELTFQITDSSDPIEIGGETMYEIRLSNSGSRNDSNVRVQLQLPQGIELVSSDADAETNGRGLVAFAPRAELAAGGDVVYRVKAKGVAPGTHLIKTVVLSDQSTVPVTKEESTMVYADR